MPNLQEEKQEVSHKYLTMFDKRENGDKIFRYRIGDYRALYSINENKKIILIIKIDKRPRVYD